MYSPKAVREAAAQGRALPSADLERKDLPLQWKNNKTGITEYRDIVIV